MDRNEHQMTVDETVADEALSPSATDGTSSSDVSDQEPESLADAMAKEFAETYGDDEPGTEETDAEPEAPEETESEQKPETKAEDGDDPEDDQFHIPDEQFKALPDGVKKRIGHLNTRWKKAERELSEMKAELPTLQDAHQRFTQIQSFVQEHNIEPQNVTKMFDMAAMLSRGDYQGFLDTIAPFYDYAAQAAGKTIAPDLQQQVEDGMITEDAAREMTRLRAESQDRKGRYEQLQQRHQQTSQAQREQQEQGRIAEAINQREAHLKATDPDYARKSPMLRSMLEMALKNGARPRNAQEAVAMLDDAYARIQEMVPAPRTTPTMPRPSTSSPPRGMPEPKTSAEAIEQALSRMPS